MPRWTRRRTAEATHPAPAARPTPVDEVYLVTLHEPYDNPDQPLPINATIVHARSLLHPSLPQPDGALIFRCLTECPTRRAGQLVPLSTLTFELNGGQLWAQVGDWEAVTEALVKLSRARHCDAMQLGLPPVTAALIAGGPHTTHHVFDGPGPPAEMGPADRQRELDQLSEHIRRAVTQGPFWPGDELITPPLHPTVMPYRPHRPA
jgi:hypothetical protein